MSGYSGSRANEQGTSGPSLLEKLRRVQKTDRDTSAREEVQAGGAREFIESVVIALVLAFLFRTYEAEAFVIPTGSMAPTLMGRHRDVVCNQCGFPYQVSASEEVGEYGNLLHPSFWIAYSRCPNCQFVNDIRNSQPFNGDRILVFKFPYDLGWLLPERAARPQRWDVIVFKYPEEPETNYIKRLVVLPGEQPAIYNGDVYVRRSEGDPYRILRKPPHKIRAMRQVVYDNNYIPADWIRRNWPLRWQLEPPSAGEMFDNGRRFRVVATGERNTATLRYHHLTTVRTTAEDPEPPKHRLVLDEYGYDNGLTTGQFMGGHMRHLRQHWVPDLGLAATVTLPEIRGSFAIEIVKAGERFTCTFDLDSGAALLRRGDRELGRAEHGISKPGSWPVEMYNFDSQLTVIVDGKPIFGDGVPYDGIGLTPVKPPTQSDTTPVALHFRGCEAEITDLVVYRDIYYTHGDGYDAAWELTDEEAGDPAEWHRLAAVEPREFPRLGPDEFMMLGDNSPKSKDSRAWLEGAEAWLGSLPDMDQYSLEQRRQIVAERRGGEVVSARNFFVHRRLLVGRAFFIYWPHGKPFRWSIPLGSHPGAVRIPFYPQISRMRFIR